MIFPNFLFQILSRLPGRGNRPYDREVRGEPAYNLVVLRPRQLVHRCREGERLESVTQDPGGLGDLLPRLMCQGQPAKRLLRLLDMGKKRTRWPQTTRVFILVG